jgi:hypothetical protein
MTNESGILLVIFEKIQKYFDLCGCGNKVATGS